MKWTRRKKSYCIYTSQLKRRRFVFLFIICTSNAYTIAINDRVGRFETRNSRWLRINYLNSIKIYFCSTKRPATPFFSLTRMRSFAWIMDRFVVAVICRWLDVMHGCRRQLHCYIQSASHRHQVCVRFFLSLFTHVKSLSLSIKHRYKKILLFSTFFPHTDLISMWISDNYKS